MAWDTEDLTRGPAPIWHEVAERLRAAIATGEFAPGDALPSEAELNRRFDISRTTARAALDALKNDRLVERQSGRGTIVLPPRADVPLNLLASFSEDMRARGLEPAYNTESVRMVQASAEVAAGLSLEQGTQVLRIQRLLCASGRPMAYSTAWLSPGVMGDSAPPSKSYLDDNSLYTWLERELNARIAVGRQYIEAGTADEKVAAKLGVEVGSAVLVARRSSCTAGGKEVEYVVTSYRADRYRFRVDLVRP
jgi:GntR family transcriptional regulator